MKLFITGVSGMLGLNMALQLRNRFDIHGSYCGHPVDCDGVNAFHLDFSSANSVTRAMASVRPEIVIHTAGLTNVDECEIKPREAHRLNVEFTQHVAKSARSNGVKLVHISTDHIFDGKSPLKNEWDTPNPINVYARTKLQAEEVVLKACPDALLVRTNFYGWGTSYRPSFTDWILEHLEHRKTLTMFTDVYYTPILINDLVGILLKLLAANATGIHHVAGGERLSKWAFAKKLARVFEYPDNPIQEISVDDFDFKALRPKDMSLNCSKVESLLGEEMPSVEAGLERLKKLGEGGWPEELEKATMDRRNA